MPSKVVIPVAGKGTRMYPLTEKIPKCMLPLGNKFVIEHILDEIVLSGGLTEVLLVVSPNLPLVENYLGKNYKGLNITYVIQEAQDGLASAIYCAKDFVGDDSFILMLGDCIVLSDNEISPLQRTIESYNRLNSSGILLVQEMPEEELSRCGVVKPVLPENTDIEFEIDDIVEKSPIEKCPSKYSVAGRYIFSQEIFIAIENTEKGVNNEYQLADAIKIIMQQHKIWCVSLQQNERIIDIGIITNYNEACQIFKETQ